MTRVKIQKCDLDMISCCLLSPSLGLISPDLSKIDLFCRGTLEDLAVWVSEYAGEDNGAPAGFQAGGSGCNPCHAV